MPRGGYRPGSGGKSKWKHGKTKVIRVPEVLADQVLQYARELDEGKSMRLEGMNKSKDIHPIAALKVIDLAGISLKAVDGQMGVKLSDLVKKGYRLIPDHLNEIVLAALRKHK